MCEVYFKYPSQPAKEDADARTNKLHITLLLTVWTFLSDSVPQCVHTLLRRHASPADVAISRFLAQGELAYAEVFRADMRSPDRTLRYTFSAICHVVTQHRQALSQLTSDWVERIVSYDRQTKTLAGRKKGSIDQPVYYALHLVLAVSLWGNCRLPKSTKWGVIAQIYSKWFRVLHRNEATHRELCLEAALCLDILGREGHMPNAQHDMLAKQYMLYMRTQWAGQEHGFNAIRRGRTLQDDYHLHILLALLIDARHAVLPVVVEVGR